MKEISESGDEDEDSLKGSQGGIEEDEEADNGVAEEDEEDEDEADIVLCQAPSIKSKETAGQTSYRTSNTHHHTMRSQQPCPRRGRGVGRRHRSWLRANCESRRARRVLSLSYYCGTRRDAADTPSATKTSVPTPRSREVIPAFSLHYTSGPALYSSKETLVSRR